MSIEQENLIPLTGYLPGQRFVLIDGVFVPVGFGTPYIPGSTIVTPSDKGVYYKCASVDTTNSKWTGYKATQLEDGTWTFAEEVTTGLSFTEITPEKDSIYSYDALVKVKLWTGSIPYKYLRFQVDAVRSGTEVQFSELTLVKNDDTDEMWSNIPISNVTADEYNNNGNSNEGPAKIADDIINNKWLSYSFNNPSYVTIEFQEGFLLDDYKGYKWYTANDSSNRDPVSWTIFVSEDGSTWEQIAKVENASITEDRNALAGTWEWNM